MRLDQRLDLNLAISQFTELNLGSYPGFGICGCDLLQTNDPSLGRFDLCVLSRGVACFLNYVAGNGERNCSQCD